MTRDRAAVTAAMRAVKSAGTSPELVLRKALSARGLRYRLHYAKAPGKPDIAFVSARVAVFVDGDYWHGNQWRLRGFSSLDEQLENVANREYWKRKIERNMSRDRENNKKLKKAGWKVIRVWESDIKKDAQKAADKVARAVAARAGGKKR